MPGWPDTAKGDPRKRVKSTGRITVKRSDAGVKRGPQANPKPSGPAK